MSEEPKITTVQKVKDPKRVEAGKRLGAVSKQAKERKARERSELSERAECADESPMSLSTVVGVVGVVVGVVGIYYARFADAHSCRQNTSGESEANRQAQLPEGDAAPTPKETKARSSTKLDSFD